MSGASDTFDADADADAVTTDVMFVFLLQTSPLRRSQPGSGGGILPRSAAISPFLFTPPLPQGRRGLQAQGAPKGEGGATGGI